MNQEKQNDAFGKTEFGSLIFIILIVCFLFLILPEMHLTVLYPRSLFYFLSYSLILILSGFTFNYFLKTLNQIFRKK